jgi:hypothetical protein
MLCGQQRALGCLLGLQKACRSTTCRYRQLLTLGRGVAVAEVAGGSDGRYYRIQVYLEVGVLGRRRS